MLVKLFVRGIVQYGTALALCLVLMTCTLELWNADLEIPFTYSGDAMPVQLWTKGMTENGWYFHNDALGAPFGHDMRDYPMADNFHFLALKALTLFRADAAFTFNIFCLATFPLTTLASLVVLRRLNVSSWAAIVASLLFTFLPYHFLRAMFGHLFLSSYFTIPLVVLVVVWIFRNELIPARSDLAGPWRGLLPFAAKSLLALLICVLISGTGIYYACFACVFLLVAGIFSYTSQQRVRALWTSVGLTVVVGLGVVGNLAPSILYRFEHGANQQSVDRPMEGPEVYGMKITQLLMPTSMHRIHSLARKKQHYSTVLPAGHGDYWYLGAIGGTGFLILVGRLLYRNPRGTAPDLLDLLGVLNIFAILLATVGGFGSLFGVYVSPVIRCYERMSIYIAFLSFCALMIVYDRWASHPDRPWRLRLLGPGMLTFALAIGILDQTSKAFIPAYQSVKEEYRNDREFISAVEAGLPRQSLLFQLPYVAFPETPPVGTMCDYDLLRGYLHSRTLRWSYGSIKGREGDAWQKSVAALPVEQLCAKLTAEGFAGIYVDRFGFKDRAAEMERQLSAILGPPAIVSGNNRLSFFELSNYRHKKLPAQTQSARR